MILRYNITLDDLVAFNRYHCKHSPSIKKTKVTCIIFFFVIFIGLSLVIDPGPGFGRPISIGIATIIAILSSLIYNYTFRWALDRQSRRMYNEGSNKGVLGQHELEIDESGLVERTEVNVTNNSWQGIERIAETDDHAFIYISALMAHIIPKHSIAAGDPDQFIATAKQMWLAANPDRQAQQKA